MYPFDNTKVFIASSLSFLMLITSVSLTVDMHFCRGQLTTFSFFGKTKTCQEISKIERMKKCPHFKKMMAQNKAVGINEKGCCENKTVLIELDKDQDIQTTTFTLNKPLKHFIKAYVITFSPYNIDIKREMPPFTLYKPPLIIRDIPVLLESYLL